jgi:hypothetical protein
MSNPLFLATEIPWGDLKAKDLEELLYWLFDSMGAKELEWRVGGSGSGTSDQGRDLELSFYTSSPDGDLVQQRWWVEAKGRRGTVEPIAVKNAVVNAVGRTDVDVVVVATNSVFSNPTKDWVKEWQRANVRPKVKLWGKTELEAFCSKNPVAVIRVFKQALSSQGKIEVAESKLWNYATFTDEPTLMKVWEDRAHLVIGSRTLVALVVSEMANGDIDSRPWGMFVGQDTLLDALSAGLVNFLHLVFRAGESGVRQEPLIRGLAYLTLVCVHRIGEKKTADVLTEVWDAVKGDEYPEKIRKSILRPILLSVNDDIHDVCTSDCIRVDTKRVSLTEQETETYWNRLSMAHKKVQKERRFIMVEDLKAPCKVGFPLGEKRTCPLCSNDKPEQNVRETLRVIKVVSDFRRPRHDV